MDDTNNNSGTRTEPTEPKLSRYRGLKPYQPGQSGNPAGRPVGSRNRLAEQFITDLKVEWEVSGASALKRVAKDDPVQFVKVVAAILPKELDMTLNVDLFAEISTFSQAYSLALRTIGAEEPLQIEGDVADDDA